MCQILKKHSVDVEYIIIVIFFRKLSLTGHDAVVDLDERHVNQNTENQNHSLNPNSHEVTGSSQETGNQNRCCPGNQCNAGSHDTCDCCEVGDDDTHNRYQQERNRHGDVVHDGVTEQHRFVDVEQTRRNGQFGNIAGGSISADDECCNQQTDRGSGSTQQTEGCNLRYVDDVGNCFTCCKRGNVLVDVDDQQRFKMEE